MGKAIILISVFGETADLIEKCGDSSSPSLPRPSHPPPWAPDGEEPSLLQITPSLLTVAEMDIFHGDKVFPPLD